MQRPRRAQLKSTCGLRALGDAGQMSIQRRGKVLWHGPPLVLPSNHVEKFTVLPGTGEVPKSTASPAGRSEPPSAAPVRVSWRPERGCLG